MSNKLTIKDSSSVKFSQSKDAKSRVVVVSGKESSQSYVVDMTNKTSASVCLAGEGQSKKVQLSGTASSLVKLMSAMTKTSPTVIRSMAITINGAKPIGR